MEIVLIRHGEPEWVRDGLNVDDPPLTQRGERQAEAMANVLRHEHFDEVFCSPLVRARQTAAPLFAALNQGETIAPWLEEIRNPIWHGTPRVVADEAYATDRARPAEERWLGLDGGEHVGEFDIRMRAGITAFLAERAITRSPHALPVWTAKSTDVKPDLNHELKHDAQNRRVALVAHAGTNSVIISCLLGIPATPWEWERFGIHHGSISRLTTMTLGDGITFCLNKLSDVEHLDLNHRTR